MNHIVQTLVATALLCVAAVGCTSVDPQQDSAVPCAPGDDSNFRKVSRVLELRCGTLDCHGSSYRPLRLYGRYGLWRPEERTSPNIPNGDYDNYYSGGTVETTLAELQDNAASICGLEPEKLVAFHEAVTDGRIPGDVAHELTIIRKARLEERHKGGKIWEKGKAGDQCLINWLLPYNPEVGVNTAPCDELL